MFIPLHSAWGFVFNPNGSQNFGDSDTQTVTVDVENSSFQQFLSVPLLRSSSGSGIQGGPDENFDLANFEGDTLLPYSGPSTAFAGNNSSSRVGITTYTVQAGDSVSSIAASFGITANTVLWANKLNESSLLQAGQELIILPVSGVMHKVANGDTIPAIAKKYKADANEIIAFNNLNQNSVLNAGDTLIIPDGEIAPAPRPMPRVVSYPSAPPSGPNVDGYYIFPTPGGRDEYRLHPHNAVDIANSCGLPILAAADGVVIIADASGWNGGYGKHIMIQHPNGTETLYAHSSKLLVGVGQQVTQGQEIALIGTTGRSTGCHVHFEVRGAKNPFARY